MAGRALSKWAGRNAWQVARYRSGRDVVNGRSRVIEVGGMLTAFVLSTGEADEMCAPMVPEISEMCALKPFSCCLLFVVCLLLLL